jgi:hypothetical protein
MFKVPGNRFQGIDSACLCSLGGSTTNRVIVPAPQATWTGRIDSLESMLGSLNFWAQYYTVQCTARNRVFRPLSNLANSTCCSILLYTWSTCYSFLLYTWSTWCCAGASVRVGWTTQAEAPAILFYCITEAPVILFYCIPEVLGVEKVLLSWGGPPGRSTCYSILLYTWSTWCWAGASA